jgi:hypothetical protein
MRKVSVPAVDEGRGDDRNRSGDALLWMAGGMFALLLAARAFLIILAQRHPVQTIPSAASTEKR